MQIKHPVLVMIFGQIPALSSLHQHFDICAIRNLEMDIMIDSLFLEWRDISGLSSTCGPEHGEWL
jgi:hypothetical protein